MNEIIIGLIAVLLQGFFAGSETAFSRANWIRLHTWNRKRPTVSFLRIRAAHTLSLIERKEQILIITLILTNLFVVITATVFSRFFIVRFGPAYTTVAVVVVVILSLVIGDFIPKIIAQAFSEYWAIVSGPLVKFCLTIFSPVLPGKTEKRYHQLSRQDFLYMLKQKPGKESIVTNQIAKALFDFSQTTVKEIMIPKERIIGFKQDIALVEVKKIVEKYRFSRYPVYKKTTDSITAIVHIKDLLLASQKQNFQLSDILRMPFLVQANDKAMPVLRAMSKKGEHLAIVHDEQNRTAGIITMEDLIEEVVGEIRSET
jgi:CBS domain containing-hemolysin-like protein